MNKWLHKIDIKQHIDEDTSNEAIVKAAKGVLKELNKLPDRVKAGDLYEYICQLEDFLADISAASEEDNDEFLSIFNYALGELYDWADNNRVWMGL